MNISEREDEITRLRKLVFLRGEVVDQLTARVRELEGMNITMYGAACRTAVKAALDEAWEKINALPRYRLNVGGLIVSGVSLIHIKEAIEALGGGPKKD